ncbi:MAG TPA: hypothetical protein VIG74_05330 [Alphaproteobacteria bacterium]
MGESNMQSQERDKQQADRTFTMAGFSSIIAGIGTGFLVMAGITAGAAITGPAALAAGALALGSIGVMALGGVAVRMARDFNGRNRNAFALAALFTSMAVGGATLTAFQMGKGLGADRLDKMSVTVSDKLQNAFKATIDPDRQKLIRKEIGDYAARRLAQENAANYELCAQNPGAFMAREIECGIYRP